ncbi:hypothetical protein, partial [Bacillus licheniformis]|uniref:hypothetical protein n=1 Tax=Bacillus licheniformis TaxID=1402 RepID=UPI001C96E79D
PFDPFSQARRSAVKQSVERQQHFNQKLSSIQQEFSRPEKCLFPKETSEYGDTSGFVVIISIHPAI